jgi:separase
VNHAYIKDFSDQTEVWLLRDEDATEQSKALLSKFHALPASAEIKVCDITVLIIAHSPYFQAEENVLMAKLALHEAYTRFRADMFLSSLAESSAIFYLLISFQKQLMYLYRAVIALPMGMTGNITLARTPSTQDISVILMNAEKLFWSDLTRIARRGQVSQIREAAMSLALIRAFQTSLGKAGLEGPILTAQLLGGFRTL